MNGIDENPISKENELDHLDIKLSKLFPGRVVRKDLVRKLKVGYNIPVYVLEYLLGKYCSTTDDIEIERGIEKVKSTISERIVDFHQSELIKARLQKIGSIKLIDLVSATFDERVQGGKFWAKMAICGLDKVHISHEIVQDNERILTGGIWANIEIIYDDTLGSEGSIRPFVIRKLSPIQIASINFDEYLVSRNQFTRNEWIDVLIRSVGFEPNHPDFTMRRKFLLLLRLIPMVEKNYNLIELGPRGTGKSYQYREISPNVILLSGGQGTIPDLFGWKNRKDKPGLVSKFDAIAFDEVAGSNFKIDRDRQMYKGYMEQGSYSRGDDKGTLSADASLIFNGNIDGNIHTVFKSGHLFNSLPDSIRNDMAFHDRWHAYLPGWEIPKIKPDHFTTHMGFIADYISEIFHAELRKRNFTDSFNLYFYLGENVEERDRKAIAKTVSGLMKLIHPDGRCAETEMIEYLEFAIEARRRVKEQLKRMGGIEYHKTNLSFLSKISGQEQVVNCKELTSLELIPDIELSPGDLYAVGYDKNLMRHSLYRIQISVSPGKQGLYIFGTVGKGIKESIRVAFDYLKSNLPRLKIEKDVTSYEINIQITNLMNGKDADDLTVAFYIALISSFRQVAVLPSLVILGHMNIHGSLLNTEELEEKLHLAIDAGAQRVIVPRNSMKNLENVPSEFIDMVQIDYYEDPLEASSKAFNITN